MAEKMTYKELAVKTRKVIELNEEKSTIKGVYFNPLFVDALRVKVPELKEFGFSLTKTDVESEDEGDTVSGKIKARDGSILSLGTVILDGKNVSIKDPLTRIDRLIDFIDFNVDEKEEPEESEEEKEKTRVKSVTLD